MPQKQVSLGMQFFIKGFDHLSLGIVIKVDNQISTKNYIKHREKCQPIFIQEVDTEKIEGFFHFLTDFIAAVWLSEKKSLEIGSIGGAK